MLQIINVDNIMGMHRCNIFTLTTWFWIGFPPLDFCQILPVLQN